MEIKEELIKEFPLFFVRMNSAQDRFIRVKTALGKTPRTRLVELANKTGKTEIGLLEDLAHLMGFRPWLLPEDPDYKIDIKVPNQGMLGCETYKHSVAEKIEPRLRFYLPAEKPPCVATYKLGPQGVLNILTLPFDAKGNKCGSKLHIRSYDEHPSSFEGQDYDFIHWDEPPPRAIWVAAERGKIVTNAPSWFTMTPLKEPWIYDELSLKAAIHG